MNKCKNSDILEGMAIDILDTLVCLITDKAGKIIYISDAYAKIAGLDGEAALNKPVYEVIPNSRMHIVAKTGKAEEGVIYHLKNGEISLITRRPIIQNGEIIGAICYGFLSETKSVCTANTINLIKRLTKELSIYKNDLRLLQGAKYSIEQIIGKSPNIQRVKEVTYKISQTKSTVLIMGETGTGKELFAHAIHQLSPRSYKPFIRINCAAIPAELFESELFGYEEGAFTGARKGGKIGKIEVADTGTLVLDEIHLLPYNVQPKLLRVLQEKEIERVGGNGNRNIDVRFICITNKNLLDLVTKGEFREDLYYRINIVPLEIPPLRERLDDIAFLVECFVEKINHNLGLNITGVNSEVIDLFKKHHWPGNVRELEHTLEQAANMVLNGPLVLENFHSLLERIQHNTEAGTDGNKLIMAKEVVEKEKILQALTQTGGNILLASKILNTPRSVLYKKLKKYNISIKNYKLPK
ncbi:MAG: sigma-54-dependent Fis family transcriptional regulator [Firmicutes bacterium]|nr:sigma-54-dependent Fis family transcriptional regulator [Bacillota bacterium]